MEKAICLSCKNQIEVNLSEKVDFCKLCGKPIETWEAVKLYRNSRKPSEEIIEKFNAIFAQDYKLAKEYLYDVIKKEYPTLSDYSSNQYISEMLSKVNRAGADAHRAKVNSELLRKWGRIFNGGLTGIKRAMMSFRERVDGMPVIKDPLFMANYWKLFREDIKGCCLQGKEFDDDFILYAIDIIKRYANLPTWGNKTFREYISISNHCDFEIKSIAETITFLENFLSPSGKICLEAKQEAERIQAKKKKKEEEYRLAYDRELYFWKQYVVMLKGRKAKNAFKHLETANKGPAYNSEIVKFKKGLFGVKYTGDINTLKAETLTELAVEYLKP